MHNNKPNNKLKIITIGKSMYMEIISVNGETKYKCPNCGYLNNTMKVHKYIKTNETPLCENNECEKELPFEDIEKGAIKNLNK